MQEFVSFCSNITDHLSNREFLLGMLLAFLLCGVIYFAIVFIQAIRRRCPAIILKEKGGVFCIYRKAFHNFLRGVLRRVPEVALKKVELYRRGKGIRINLKLAAKPGANIVALHENLRKDIIKNVAEKLGLIDQIESLNLLFVSLPHSDELQDGAKAEQAPAVESVEKPQELTEAPKTSEQ